MYLIFDTETTGLPKNWKAPITDTNNWPRCVQIAWQLHDELGELIEAQNYLIKPVDYYYTNPIARSSKVMSECRQISKKFLFTGIEKAS